MADPFIGEIRPFGFNFAPVDWAQCDGQLLPIAQNTALFSILGTTYGGNGINIFQLPNLGGNVPVGAGAGPGLTPRELGETGGEASAQLQNVHVPPHTHTLQGVGRATGDTTPGPQEGIARASNGNPFVPASADPAIALAPNTLSPVGGGQPHNNLMPFLTINFCIALKGTFPPRP